MTKAAELIRDGESLISAKRNGSGVEISTYDDGFGPLWLHRDSMGISGIVRAQTWEDAYSICEDEFFPEADETVDELVKEYGEKWTENAEFCEAYGFRPNGRNERDKIGHAIYAKDLNGDYLDRLTPELLTDLDIELTIETEDED